jgi:hypothetical protein
MNALLRLVLLASCTAGIVGCSFHSDIEPASGGGTDMNKKTTTTTDANGQVIEKKTVTEPKPY